MGAAGSFPAAAEAFTHRGKVARSAGKRDGFSGSDTVSGRPLGEGGIAVGDDGRG